MPISQSSSRILKNFSPSFPFVFKHLETVTFDVEYIAFKHLETMMFDVEYIAFKYLETVKSVVEYIVSLFEDALK